MSARQVMDLIAYRTKFLQKHPELVELQEKIDKKLNGAGSNNHNRCVLIQQMMMEEVKNLQEANNELYKSVEELSKACKE